MFAPQSNVVQLFRSPTKKSLSFSAFGRTSPEKYRKPSKDKATKGPDANVPPRKKKNKRQKPKNQSKKVLKDAEGENAVPEAISSSVAGSLSSPDLADEKVSVGTAMTPSHASNSAVRYSMCLFSVLQYFVAACEYVGSS